MNNSERDYANSIYDSIYECGQRLAKEQKEQEKAEIKNCPIEIANDIWNAAIEAAAELIDEMGEEARITEYIRELKK